MGLFFLARTPVPEDITYGMSFSADYARELGLPWRDVYDAILTDLQVRHLRLMAHWTMVEPTRDEYQFRELDYQLSRAAEEGATVIMSVGMRVPRWPECHIPEWADGLSKAAREREILELITQVVNRYKDEEVITHWQVENEPYLEVFAREHCPPLDERFLDQEIALVRTLDPDRPILLTDSGNLGRWAGAYQRADVFGTSVYVHFWTPEFGQYRTILPPWFYRVKDNLMALRYGEKPTMLIELAAEPWLPAPITEVPVAQQLDRMNPDLFRGVVEYAAETRFAMQYLWGAEWWYWLREQGDAEMWQLGRALIKTGSLPQHTPRE